MVISTANVWRNEVEAVRRERALNQIDAAIVHDTAGRNLIEHVGAQLLKPLIIDDARRGGRGWGVVSRT